MFNYKSSHCGVLSAIHDSFHLSLLTFKSVFLLALAGTLSMGLGRLVTQLLPNLLGYGLGLCCSLFAAFLGLALVYQINLLATEDRCDYRAALRIASRCFPRFILSSLLMLIITTACLLLGFLLNLLLSATLPSNSAAIIIGILVGIGLFIFLSVSLAYNDKTILFENASAIKSLSLSFKLVLPDWWKTFKLSIAGLFISVFIMLGFIVITLPLSFLLGFSQSHSGNHYESVIPAITQMGISTHLSIPGMIFSVATYQFFVASASIFIHTLGLVWYRALYLSHHESD